MPLKSVMDFVLQYGAFIRPIIKLVTTSIVMIVVICPLMSDIRDAIPTSVILLFLDLVIQSNTALFAKCPKMHN